MVKVVGAVADDAAGAEVRTPMRASMTPDYPSGAFVTDTWTCARCGTTNAATGYSCMGCTGTERAFDLSTPPIGMPPLAMSGSRGGNTQEFPVMPGWPDAAATAQLPPAAAYPPAPRPAAVPTVPLVPSVPSPRPAEPAREPAGAPPSSRGARRPKKSRNPGSRKNLLRRVKQLIIVAVIGGILFETRGSWLPIYRDLLHGSQQSASTAANTVSTTAAAACPAKIADTFPDGAGAGATLVESRSTSQYDITICDSNGHLYYYGVSRTNAALAITLPATKSGSNYVAMNQNFTYSVTPTKLVVSNQGAVVVEQNFTN